MTKKNLIIIQARLSSSRLPNKALFKLGNTSVIERMVSIANASKYGECIIATSNNKSDDLLVNLLENKNINYYRGDLNNVFRRFKKLIYSNNLDSGYFIRLTADCPLLDYKLINHCVEQHKKNNNIYTRTDHNKSLPLGQSVEVVDVEAFMNINENELNDNDKEHVTPYFYKNKKFKTESINNFLIDQSISKNIRITLDEIDDYKLISKVNEKLNFSNKNLPDLNKIIELYKIEPQLFKLNSNVKQVS